MAEIVDFGLQQHKIKMDSRYFENVLSVVAGDTGRRIEVQLLDTNGMVQNTTGLNLRLNAVIAGKATFTDATLVDAATGKYQLDLSNGMFLAPGSWQFQWQITDSAGKKLHSFAFTGNVGSNISEGGSQATNFYLNLEDLKAMQEDLVNGTFNSEALETNIAGKLTDLETQYAPKLTEVTAQLAQTATKIEVSKKADKVEVELKLTSLDNKKADQDFVAAQFSSIVSGAPKDTYTTLNELKTAYPNGTDGVMLVLANNHWYYWDGAGWVDGGLYNSQGIGDGDITPEKTDFAIEYPGTANLFDENKAGVGYGITDAGVIYANASYYLSDFIPVSKAKTYSQYGAVSDMTAEFDQYKTFVKGQRTRSFTTSPSTAYVRMGIPATYLDQAMLVEGSVLPSYVPYERKITIPELDISAVLPNQKKYEGLRAGFTGDSIVALGSRLLSKLKEELGFSEIINYGVGGSGIAPVPNRTDELATRYVNMDDTLDVILGMSGTNNFPNNTPLGTKEDTSIDTFYGALDVLFKGLRNKYPTKKIIWFTMIPRYSTVNGNGDSIWEFADAILYKAGQYGIPCYDMLRNTFLRPDVAANANLYYTEGSGTPLHPTAEGYDVMLPQMSNFISDFAV